MSNEDMIREIEARMLEPPDDPEPECYCEYCGQPMFIGEQKWTIGGDVICEDCARNNFMEIITE